MKAAVIRKNGPSDVLQIEEIDKPIIENDNQVLIKLKAAGINPIDTKLRKQGSFSAEQMPVILGCDGAGIVEEVGQAVTKFKVGDSVYFYHGGLGAKNTGCYAQYAVVSEHRLAKKPESISFTDAAAFPAALITAWESLYDRGGLCANSKVLIHGGAGGVGHIAIQLAKLIGAQVATTVSNSTKAKIAQDLGADRIIFYRESDFVEDILDWTEGEGVDLVFDTVGGDMFFKSIAVVKIYGDMVTIVEPDIKLGDFKLARSRNIRIGFVVLVTPEVKNLVKAQKHQTFILEESAKYIDQSKLKVHVSQTYPLSQANQAHELVEKGSVTGKVVLNID